MVVEAPLWNCWSAVQVLAFPTLSEAAPAAYERPEPKVVVADQLGARPAPRDMRVYPAVPAEFPESYRFPSRVSCVVEAYAKRSRPVKELVSERSVEEA